MKKYVRLSENQAHHRLRAGGAWCRGEEEESPNKVAVEEEEEESIPAKGGFAVTRQEEVEVKGRPAPPRGSFPAEVRFIVVGLHSVWDTRSIFYKGHHGFPKIFPQI